MKHFIFIALCLFALPAAAQDVNTDGYVKLPGNAYYNPNVGSGDNVYIYRRYGVDDYVLRGLGVKDTGRIHSHNFPTNDFSTICGNVERQSQRRKCRSDVMDLNKDREKLYQKYN